MSIGWWGHERGGLPCHLADAVDVNWLVPPSLHRDRSRNRPPVNAGSPEPPTPRRRPAAPSAACRSRATPARRARRGAAAAPRAPRWSRCAWHSSSTRSTAVAGLLEQQLAVVGRRVEAADDDLGICHRLGRVGGDRGDDDQHAVGGEVAAVAQHDVAHVRRRSGRRRGSMPASIWPTTDSPSASSSSTRAVVGDAHRVGRHAGPPRPGGRARAASGTRRARARSCAAAPCASIVAQLVGRRRGPRRARSRSSSVSTFAPIRHRRLTVSFTFTSLPGTGLGRHDDRVAVVDLHGRVVAERDPRQRRAGSPWLPVQRITTSCGMNSIERAWLDQAVVGDGRVAEVAGDVQVADHRAADHAHRAAVGLRRRRSPAAGGGCATRTTSRSRGPAPSR